MNKRLNAAKYLLIATMIILIVAIFALPSIAVLLKHVCYKPVNDNNVATIQSERYDFKKAETLKDGRRRISNEDYNKYKEYSIWDLEGLQIFAQIVNTENCESSKYYDSFVGRTVYLEDHIDCGDSAVSIGQCYELLLGTYNNKVFKGNFNGQFKTIKNFKSTNFYKNYISNDTHYYYGFFTYACGTISNLRLCDFEVVSEEDSSARVHISRGSIVGFVSAKGDPSAHITQCTIENYTGRAESNNKYFIWAEPSCESSYKMTYCYFKPSEKQSRTNIGGNYSFATHCIVVWNGSGGKYNTSTHCTAKKYGASNEDKDWVGLEHSSKGGDDVGKYWYNGGEKYKDGWLYPRYFITHNEGVGWKDVKFKYENATGPELIKIPNDANETFAPTSQTEKTITIYNQEVKAEPANDCCYQLIAANNDGWKCESVTSYTMKYSHIKRKVVVTMQEKEIMNVEILCGTQLSAQDISHQEIKIGENTLTAPIEYYITNASEIVEALVSPIHEDKDLEIVVELKHYSIVVS